MVSRRVRRGHHGGQPLPGIETTLESNISAPLMLMLPVQAPAIMRPQELAPVFMVMSKAESTLPLN